MNILCLTGWQQKPDAFANIAPAARHFNYAAYNDLETMFSELPRDVDLAIGWSLGGQLLVRAIAGGYVKARKLLLLAAPFQCISDNRFMHGMAQDDFNDIRNNYVQDPQKMLAQFQGWLGFGSNKIIRELLKSTEIWKNGLFWLDELGKATCRDLDFSSFPETLIFHGESDKVIPPENAKEFAARVPGAQLFLLPDVNHAIHLQDNNFLKNIITKL